MTTTPTTTESKTTWTRGPLRDAGSMIAPSGKRSRFLVGGNKVGQYSTVFVESACATKTDIARFEATVDRLRDCYNAMRGVPDPGRAVGAVRKTLTHVLARLEHGPAANPNDGLLHDVRSALALLGATKP